MAKQEKYKLYTVKELIVALREMTEKGNGIDLDSEIVISDFNMSGFKERISVYPVSRYGRMCVGLFHTLENDEDSILAKLPPKKYKEFKLPKFINK